MSGHQNPNEMAISELELATMTDDLQAMHESSMIDVHESMASLRDRFAAMTPSFANRRSFLIGGAAILGTAAIAACGSSSSGGSTGGSTPTGSTTGASGSSPYTGDLEVVALAAALENLAVAGYSLVLKKASAGKYGKVPPAIATFVTTVRKQHQDHSAAWNSVLKSAGVPAMTTAPLTIAKPSVAALQGAKTLGEVATIALNLENAAAETYVFASANVSSPAGIATAASIAPVEAMHAAILSFVLGKYPVPNTYIGTTKAVPSSALMA